MIWRTRFGKGKAKRRKPLTYKDILDEFNAGIGQGQQQIHDQDQPCRPAAP